VKAVAVEQSLAELPYTEGTKAKPRNIMSALFDHAIRCEWLERSPISLVRQNATRECIPEMLDVGQLGELLAELQHPYKIMMFLAPAAGLRASELLSLTWQHVGFESLEISLNCAVVHRVVRELKTGASQKLIPPDPELAHELLEWRYLSPFNQQADWAFASPEMKGRQPSWPANLLRRYIRPTAARRGIQKTIIRHTFRHS
jgi:site-specific recombinase XerD